MENHNIRVGPLGKSPTQTDIAANETNFVTVFQPKRTQAVTIGY
jgi:hypothetical protein